MIKETSDALENIVKAALPSTFILWRNRSTVPPKGVIYVAPRILPGATSPFSAGFLNNAGVWSVQDITLEVRILVPEGKGTKTAFEIAEILSQATKTTGTITLTPTACVHLVGPSTLLELGEDETKTLVFIHNTSYRLSRRG